MMNTARLIFVAVVITAVGSLGLAGCEDNSERPTDDHPTNEKPAAEHPANEHPAGEHPE